MKRSETTLPDTNAILRYLLKDIPEQFNKSADLFEKARIGTERIMIIESVLLECAYVLIKFYNIPKQETATVLINLLQYKGVVNRDRSIMVEALRLFSENNLDLADCMLIANARYRKMKLFTFDKAILKLQPDRTE